MDNYIHINEKDDLHNEADFFLMVGDKGTGLTKDDVPITLCIVSEDIHGKHTFYTSEEYDSFLERLNIDYIFDKYGVKRIFDSKKFKTENIKKVLEDRRCKDLSKDEAYELYTFLRTDCNNIKSEDELYYLIKDNLVSLDPLDDYFYIYHKWSDRQISFYEKIWNSFISDLKELKEEV